MSKKPKTLDFVMEEGSFSTKEEINYIGILGRERCSMQFPREMPFRLVRRILRRELHMAFWDD